MSERVWQRARAASASHGANAADIQMTADGLALTHDSTLVLRGDALASMDDWIPFERTPAVTWSGQAVLELAHGDPRQCRPVGPRVLTVGSVAAHGQGEVTHLASDAGIIGTLRLAERRARVVLPRVTNAKAHADAHVSMTIAAAFLLGRVGAALIHAGAVVDPQGGAWLLVGDSHVGKSTTVATLVHAGWCYLADDQVVLRSDGSSTLVEGWPRRAHLDAGWHAREIRADRATVDLRQLWPGHWRRTAPLAGLWFPTVRPQATTEAQPVRGADALSRLVRQSPWLVADRAAAPTTLGVLERAASLPALAISLGRDCYADADVLLDALGAHEALYRRRVAAADQKKYSTAAPR